MERVHDTPYFTCMWIMQEVALSRELWLCSGRVPASSLPRNPKAARAAAKSHVTSLTASLGRLVLKRL